MRGLLLAILFCILGWIPIYAQLSNLGHNPRVSHLLDRMETAQLLEPSHLSIRSMSLKHIINHQVDAEMLSAIDGYDWENMLLNVPEAQRGLYENKTDTLSKKKGFFNSFYKLPHSFYTLDKQDFFLKVDPILQFELGDDSHDDEFIFQNTRGIRIRGTIDNKVYFHSEILENQQRFLNFEEAEIARINAIPGQGFF